jgi:hypothetical protein
LYYFVQIRILAVLIIRIQDVLIRINAVLVIRIPD